MGSLIGGIVGLFAGEFVYFTMIGGLGSATMGLLFGSGFAAVLSLMERSRTFDELSSKRAGAWGFMVGVAVPLLGNLASLVLVGSSVPLERLIPVLLAGSASYGFVTGLLAAGTVALAKRAPSSLGPGEGEALLIGRAENDDMVEGGLLAQDDEPATRSDSSRGAVEATARTCGGVVALASMRRRRLTMRFSVPLTTFAPVNHGAYALGTN